MKIAKQKLDDIIKEEILKLWEEEKLREGPGGYLPSWLKYEPGPNPNVDTRPHGRRWGEKEHERRTKKPSLTSAETQPSIKPVDVDEFDQPTNRDRRRSGEKRRKKTRVGPERRVLRPDPMTTRDTQATIEPVADPHAPKKKPSRWQKLSKSKLGRGLGRVLGPLAAGYEGYRGGTQAVGDEGFDIPLTAPGIPGVDYITRPIKDKISDTLGIPTSVHVPGLDMLPDTGDEGIDFSPREIGAGVKQGWKELTGQQRGDEKSLYRRWLDSAKQEEGIIRENKEKTRLLILAGVKRKTK